MKAIELKCNKKLLQNRMMTEKNKQITMKDLSNMQTKLRTGENNLRKAEAILKEKGANVHFLHSDKTYKGLYFSTNDMRASLAAWSEIVFFDGTYKLLNTKLTLMLFLVEDSDGHGEIVGVGLLACEDYPSMKWMLNTFKKENESSYDKIKCFMTDKDLVERKVLKEIFPGVSTYICRFHTLNTFRRHVTTKDMDITLEQKEKCLKHLEGLVYSSCQTDYDEKYAKFQGFAPKKVLDYFNNNWHINRTEWTEYGMLHGSLLNFTNNRLEAQNAKIKQVIEKNSPLTSFLDDFFIWLKHHNLEVDVNASKNFLKTTNIFNGDNVKMEYKDYLTLKAFKYVEAELDSHEFITILRQDDSSQECIIQYKSLTMMGTEISCKCPVWISAGLPCRHIFSVKKHYGKPLFHKELCSEMYQKLLQKNSKSFPEDSQ